AVKCRYCHSNLSEARPVPPPRSQAVEPSASTSMELRPSSASAQPRRRGLLMRILLALFDNRKRTYGPVNSKILCPHCQTRGQVRAKVVEQKRGISGGKATGALLTGGLSLLVTGLSRKEKVTQARCDNCESIWHF